LEAIMLSFTPDNINALFKLHLADPVGKKSLQDDWKKFFSDNFELREEQRHDLAHLPADRVTSVQRAIGTVVKGGGSIELEEENATEWLLEFRTSRRLGKSSSPSSSPEPEWTKCSIWIIKFRCRST
jgi:hypothetical protein